MVIAVLHGPTYPTDVDDEDDEDDDYDDDDDGVGGAAGVGQWRLAPVCCQVVAAVTGSSRDVTAGDTAGSLPPMGCRDISDVPHTTHYRDLTTPWSYSIFEYSDILGNDMQKSIPLIQLVTGLAGFIRLIRAILSSVSDV